jgi:RHS repeat-associated protein
MNNASGAPLTNRISAYTYDAAGNVTNDGGAYTYDAASRMKTAGGTNYGFDGDGRRVRVQQGGYSSIYYLWSSVLGQPVAEIVGDTGNLFQAYVYGPGGGQMVALLSNDGTFYWNHPDHLGSGRKLTDSTGAVRYRGEFDPHGQVLLEVMSGGTGTYANSHKYTGYEREWSTNLDYAKARMFNHNRARFMQPDPLGLAAADVTAPQTLNQYSYVANDPVNFVDPTGTDIIAITTCVTIRAEGEIISIDCETKYYITSGGPFSIGGGGGPFSTGGGGGGGSSTGPANGSGHSNNSGIPPLPPGIKVKGDLPEPPKEIKPIKGFPDNRVPAPKVDPNSPSGA